MEQQVTPLLDHQLEPLGPLRRGPANPGLTVLEFERRRSPRQQGDRLALSLDGLPKEVSDRRRLPQIMFLRQFLIEPLDLLWLGQNSH